MPFLTANSTASDKVPARSHAAFLALGMLAAGELLAFWLVCSQQVRLAEVRHEEAAVQQMALADCLQFIPGSTIASCRSPQPAGARAAPSPVKAAAAVPVSFRLR
ncbi:MAG: hypothetical protein KGL68_16025 [Burkholderiales bacterium]|nr:hypothetical protein [Burkholderiales bacterium]